MAHWILALIVLLVPPAMQRPEPEVIALGLDAREQTAALVVARAFFESAFRRDVDEGRVRGDGGRAACLMQMHFSPQGWTTDELVADRSKCFRAALELMRRSLRVCQSQQLELRLAAFTGGRCDRGTLESQRTFAKAEWLIAQRPPRGVARGID
jgi:hypothetical protein